MTKEEIIGYIAEKLGKYGATVLDYNGTKFVGIKNPYSTEDMAFAFYDEVFTAEFTYQSARFAYEDYASAVVYAEKILNGESVTVEIFINEQPTFGGTRPYVDFSEISDKDGFAKWYACGNEQAELRIRGLLDGDGVSAKIFGWKGVAKQIDFRSN